MKRFALTANAYLSSDALIIVRLLATFQLCSRLEGIIPALESTHALVYAMKRAKELRPDQILIVNLSGRGDKDVQQVAAMLAQAKSS